MGESTLQDKASLYLFDIESDELNFNDVRTIDKANVLFNRVNLTQSRFSGTNIERFTFSNVTWPKIEHRNALFEEKELRKGKSFGQEVSADNFANIQEQVTENYRQLVLNYEAKRNYELAESFHTSEMEMLRQQAADALPTFFGRTRLYLNTYWLYKILSGYGANYKRAALVLAFLLLLFSALFLFNGIKFKDGSSFNYDVMVSETHPSPPSLSIFLEDFKTSFAMTLSIVTLQKDKPMEPSGVGGTLLASFLLLLVPAQAALLLFALRRKFRRASI